MLPSIAEKIVAEVSQKVGLELRFEGFHLHGPTIKVRMVKSNKQAVIVGYDMGKAYQFVIRSLLTRRREGRGFTWHINGQPDRNCLAVQEWGEGEFVYRFTQEEIEATWRAWAKGDQARIEEGKAKGWLKLPGWLQSRQNA